MSNIPNDLLYTKEHEWLRIDGKTCTIGITQFAVEQLGDITRVELPAEGDNYAREAVFGTVESVKAVSDIFAPVTGKVVKVNTPLNDSPEYLNDDPYDEGWMVTIEMSNESEKDELMSPEQYAAFLKEQD